MLRREMILFLVLVVVGMGERDGFGFQRQRGGGNAVRNGSFEMVRGRGLRVGTSRYGEGQWSLVMRWGGGRGSGAYWWNRGGAGTGVGR